MSTKPKYLTAKDGYRAMQIKMHTRQKLHYIYYYVDEFCTATRQKWPNRCYIDLLSGPGINVFDSTQDEIYSASFAACNHKHPFTHYFLNDADPESVDALLARINAINLKSRAKVFIQARDCNDVVDEVVRMIPVKSSVNLAVLDGFGVECHWVTVQKLASIPRMDLVILFPGNMSIVRNADRWSIEDDARLDLYMPNKAWRDVWNAKRKSGSGATADLLKLYVDGLSSLGYPSNLIHTQLIRSETDQPLYHLIYASRHPLGGKFWKQATGRDDEGQISLPL